LGRDQGRLDSSRPKVRSYKPIDPHAM